jgi:hypothetical protein
VPDTEAPTAPLPTAPAEYLPEPDESVYVTAPPADEEPQPIDWTAPSPIAEAALNDEPRQARSARTRGVPAAPAMVAAANGMALAATTAYEAGGLMALASTATVLLGGTGALVGRRRSTVRNRKAAAGAAKTLGAGNRAANARTGAGRSGAGAGNVSGGARAGGGRGRDTTGHTRGGHSGAGHRAGGLDSRPHGARAETGAPGTAGHLRAGSGLPGGSAIPGTGGRPGMPGQGARANGGRPAAAPGKGGMLARIADRLAGGTGKSGPKNKPDGPKKTDGAKKNDKSKSTDPTDPSSPNGQTPASRARRSAAATARLAKRAAARTGRLGAEGLRRSKPYRGKAAATLRRAAAKTGAAGWDATAALTRGVLAALRHGDLRTGWQRLIEVWRRRRQDRATRAALKNAAKTQATAAPTVADTVRRPSTAMTARTTTAAGASMSGHHFLASATEMARAASAYDPTGMLQVGQDFAGLQESLELVAQSMKISTDKADAKQPLDPRIIEMMRGIYQLQMKAAQLASELPGAFEQLHQVDLQRLRNPRKGAAGERMWDVSTNL